MKELFGSSSEERIKEFNKMLSGIKLYYRWWKTWKKPPVFAWIKGASLYRIGRYDLALKEYKRGLLKYPEHPARFSARLDLAYCLFKLKRFDDAQEQLKTLVNDAPHLRDAHIRLARIQMWIGHSLDAAWTARRALQRLPVEPELVGLFILNVVEHEGTSYLLQEALKYAESLLPIQKENPILKTAMAKLDLFHGDKSSGREKLVEICTQVECPIEALILLADELLEEGNLAQSRHELKRAMNMIAEHPRVLSLLAETYLRSGPFYNADYARQLATSACQSSQWLSPREMHILAESYYHQGDKISALVLASKAKQAGSQLLGTYRDVKNLDRLIETLSTGTQA